MIMQNIRVWFRLGLLAVLLTIAIAIPSVRSQWIQTSFQSSKQVRTILVNGGDIFAGTWGEGVFRSTDSGKKWAHVDSGLVDGYINALIFHHNSLFLGTQDSGVYRSYDSGMNWMAANSGISNYAIHAFAISDSNLFVGSDGHVFRSRNDGKAWDETDAGLITATPLSFLVKNEKIFAGTYNYGLFLSTNMGSTWIQINDQMNYPIHSIVTCGQNLIAVSDRGIFLSQNDGLRWTLKNPDSSSYGFGTALAVRGPNVFAIAAETILFSSDEGENWSVLDNAPSCISLALSDSDIFVGTHGGAIWHRRLSEMISTSAEVKHTPAPPHSEEVYPNPLTHSTTIRFTPTERGFAQVTIVNLLGETVARLFEGELEAGEYYFEWDAKAAVPGTYFCRIREGAAGGALHAVPLVLAR